VSVADDECPGEGKCHGCLGWCDRCGDVGEVCNYPDCDQHHCLICGETLVEATQAESDRPTWCVWCDRDYEVGILKRKADGARKCGHVARAESFEAQARALEITPL